MLARTLTVPAGNPRLSLDIGHLRYRPWRLQVFVDDDIVATQVIGGEDTVDLKEVKPNAVAATPTWAPVTFDLSRCAGRQVKLRLYHWLVPDRLPGAAYWRTVKVE